MKKAAVLAAALALVMSLAACGNRDDGNQNNNQPNTGTMDNNGGSSNGTTNGTTNGTGDGAISDNNGSLTDPAQNGTSSDPSLGSTGSGSNTSMQSRSRVGNDLRRAADGVGDVVSDLVDDGRDALSRAASATTFERMLDNARVHDTDGVLTDGENSHW